MHYFETKTKIVYDDKKLESLAEFQDKKISILTTFDVHSTYEDKIVSHLQSKRSNVFIIDPKEIMENPDKRISLAEEIHKQTPEIILCFGKFSLFNAAKLLRFQLHEINPDLQTIFIHMPLHAAGGNEISSMAYFFLGEDRKLQWIDFPYLSPDILILSPTLSGPEELGEIHDMAYLAICSAVESYISTASNSFSTLFSNRALKTLNRSIFLIDKDNYSEKMAQLQMGSSLAGIAVNHSSTGLAELFSLFLEQYFSVSMEKFLPIIMPQIISFNMKNSLTQRNYAKLARKINFHYDDDEMGAQILLENLKSIGTSFSLPTKLWHLGINYTDLIEKMNIFTTDIYNNQHLVNNPLQMTAEQIRQLILNVA